MDDNYKAEQNPKFDIDSLRGIKIRIEKNVESEVDYCNLDYFVYSIYNIKDFILNKLKENGYDNYETFRLEKLKPTEKNIKLIRGTLLGHINGVISTLEDYLNKK